jgi:hypothetical protein
MEAMTAAAAPHADEVGTAGHRDQQPAVPCASVTRRQMLTGFATAGLALAQLPLVAPAMAQATPAAGLAPQSLTYYLNVSDFVKSLVEIPATPIKFKHAHITNTTADTQYLAGVAKVYVSGGNGQSFGRCSASFLCLKNDGTIYTDISNYISLDNGLIVSWFTPTTVINLALDTIIHSMVTECIVVASTKIGVNLFYGESFNLKVSSVASAGVQQVQFEFTQIT